MSALLVLTFPLSLVHYCCVVNLLLVPTNRLHALASDHTHRQKLCHDKHGVIRSCCVESLVFLKTMGMHCPFATYPNDVLICEVLTRRRSH